MTAFALIHPPEPELPAEPPKPTKAELKRERRLAMVPKADEATVPMVAGEAWKGAYRVRMLERDPHCIYCGKIVTSETATAEHAIPRSRGGWNSPGNVWLACKTCNTFKGDRTPLEWLQQVYDACVKMGFIDDDEEPAIAYAVGEWD